MTKRALIFDLDGTLVDSQLDFASMRAELGIPDSADILSWIADAEPAEQERLHAIVHKHELTGANKATLMPGAKEILAHLQAHRIPVAILTRNSRAVTALTLARLEIAADLVVAREDAPPKPDPSGLQQILAHWQVAPADALFVGDYLYDLEAGLRAGVRTILFAPKTPDFPHDHPDVVDHLLALKAYIG